MNHHVISPEEYRALIEARDAAIRDLVYWSREAGRWRGTAEGLEIERDRLASALATAHREGAEAMRERAARAAKSAWLTCPYGDIADADAMCALSEHAEETIRALPLGESQ